MLGSVGGERGQIAWLALGLGGGWGESNYWHPGTGGGLSEADENIGCILVGTSCAKSV